LQNVPGAVGAVIFFVALVGALVLDRLPQLNPVNFLVLSDRLWVTRLAGRPRPLTPAGVNSIELAPRDGEDYDDRDRGQRLVNAVVRIDGGWPARLVVTGEAATSLADWARRHGRPVHESPPTGREPG
jgi:hypothetical protein